MPTVEEILDKPRPSSVADARANWPVRDQHTASPTDWRDECLYFVMPDRFDDGADRPPLARNNLSAWRGQNPDWGDAEWRAWARSGRTRYQGGTLKGLTNRLPYLKKLGVTALWVAPVWKQQEADSADGEEAAADPYHGYAIADFLDVDPRLGSRADLVAMVAEAHRHCIRVIFDIVVNHTGRRWLYKVDGEPAPRGLDNDPNYDNGKRYGFGAWLDGNNQPMAPDAARGPDDSVWPSELQNPDVYHRMGQIRDKDWGGLFWDDNASFRVADMYNRDLMLTGGPVDILQVMIVCWTYWLALTDCDGFRIDTLKHTTVDEARIFCGAVREFAESVGKENLLLVGEVAAPPSDGVDAGFEGVGWDKRYMAAMAGNLTATLEVAGDRARLRQIAIGGDPKPNDWLSRFADYSHRYDFEHYDLRADPLPPTQRTAGAAVVMTVDDHDGLYTEGWRLPFTTRLANPAAGESETSFFHPLQAVPGIALLLFTLSIPCLYYGTEQGMAGPAVRDTAWLPAFGPSDKGHDRYLREAMFGPTHPRKVGAAGRPDVPGNPTEDSEVPGFGPFGTVGGHLFHEDGAVFLRAQLLLDQRKKQRPLRSGRQYGRAVTWPGADPVSGAAVGGVVAWSRILADREVVVVVNTNPPLAGPVTVQVLVDAGLNLPAPGKFRIAASTAECEKLGPAAGTGLPVQGGAPAYVVVPDLLPHEVVVLEQTR